MEAGHNQKQCVQDEEDAVGEGRDCFLASVAKGKVYVALALGLDQSEQRKAERQNVHLAEEGPRNELEVRGVDANAPECYHDCDECVDEVAELLRFFAAAAQLDVLSYEGEKPLVAAEGPRAVPVRAK